MLGPGSAMSLLAEGVRPFTDFIAGIKHALKHAFGAPPAELSSRTRPPLPEPARFQMMRLKPRLLRKAMNLKRKPWFLKVRTKETTTPAERPVSPLYAWLRCSQRAHAIAVNPRHREGNCCRKE